MIFDNCQETIREIADVVGISLGSSNFYGCFRHETCGSEDYFKIVQLHRIDVAQEMFTTFNDDSDLLKKVITGNGSWVYDYDIETKSQSSQ